MTIESLAAGATSAIGTQAPTRVELGWGASLGDLAAFDRSMHKAMDNSMGNVVHRIEGRPMPEASPVAQALMRPLENVNARAVDLAKDAKAAEAAGQELTPSQLISLTVRAQEFMFYCQLTSNVANRTSDGLQQLFRQQS